MLYFSGDELLWALSAPRGGGPRLYSLPWRQFCWHLLFSVTVKDTCLCLVMCSALGEVCATSHRYRTIAQHVFSVVEDFAGGVKMCEPQIL